MWRRAKERLGWASLATGKLEEIFISLRFSVKVPLNKNNNTHTHTHAAQIEIQLPVLPCS